MRPARGGLAGGEKGPTWKPFIMSTMGKGGPASGGSCGATAGALTVSVSRVRRSQSGRRT
jgi:hypothetical protein